MARVSNYTLIECLNLIIICIHSIIINPNTLFSLSETFLSDFVTIFWNNFNHHINHFINSPETILKTTLKNDTRVNYKVEIFEGILKKRRNKFINTNTKFDSMPGDELIKKSKADRRK